MSRVPGGRSVLVRVPASSANLGPGFDSIGLALGLWDHYVVSTTDAPGLLIEVSGEGADDVPTDERHLVHATMRHTWGVLGWEPPTGLRIEARNGVPHSRGLGSSATAIAAGVVAAQALSADGFPEPGEPVDDRPVPRDAHREHARGTPRQRLGQRAGGPDRQLDARRQRPRPWRPDRHRVDRPAPRRRRRRAGARDTARHPHGQGGAAGDRAARGRCRRCRACCPARARPDVGPEPPARRHRATGSTRRRVARPTRRPCASSTPCAPRGMRPSCPAPGPASSCSRRAPRLPACRRRRAARAGSG